MAAVVPLGTIVGQCDACLSTEPVAIAVSGKGRAVSSASVHANGYLPAVCLWPDGRIEDGYGERVGACVAADVDDVGDGLAIVVAVGRKQCAAAYIRLVDVQLKPPGSCHGDMGVQWAPLEQVRLPEPDGRCRVGLWMIHPASGKLLCVAADAEAKQ